MFDLQESIKNLAGIDNKRNMMIKKFKTKTKIEYDDKNRVVSTSKKQDALLDFYLHYKTIVYMHQKFQCGEKRQFTK